MTKGDPRTRPPALPSASCTPPSTSKGIPHVDSPRRSGTSHGPAARAAASRLEEKAKRCLWRACGEVQQARADLAIAAPSTMHSTCPWACTRPFRAKGNGRSMCRPRSGTRAACTAAPIWAGDGSRSGAVLTIHNGQELATGWRPAGRHREPPAPGWRATSRWNRPGMNTAFPAGAWRPASSRMRIRRAEHAACRRKRTRRLPCRSRPPGAHERRLVPASTYCGAPCAIAAYSRASLTSCHSGADIFVSPSSSVSITMVRRASSASARASGMDLQPLLLTRERNAFFIESPSGLERGRSVKTW